MLSSLPHICCYIPLRPQVLQVSLSTSHLLHVSAALSACIHLAHDANRIAVGIEFNTPGIGIEPSTGMSMSLVFPLCKKKFGPCAPYFVWNIEMGIDLGFRTRHQKRKKCAEEMYMKDDNGNVQYTTLTIGGKKREIAVNRLRKSEDARKMCGLATDALCVWDLKSEFKHYAEDGKILMSPKVTKGKCVPRCSIEGCLTSILPLPVT